jgi:hypothetical protein
MRGQWEALVLRGVVTGITLVATVVSAVYVGAHVKNPTAPLRPSVIRGPSALSQAPGGKLSLTPSVRSSDVQPVTSTYAS